MTPFDKAIKAVEVARYHNHRLETHSDTVSNGLFEDLLSTCKPLREDLENGVVRVWLNVSAPGDRLRKVDLFVGEPTTDGKPDITKVRIALENKSVITAHRNRTNRFDDLKKVLAAIHDARPEALLVATVLVGLSQSVLNIPDQVRKFYRDRDVEFEEGILPRLSSGDESLRAAGPSHHRQRTPSRVAETESIRDRCRYGLRFNASAAVCGVYRPLAHVAACRFSNFRLPL